MRNAYLSAIYDLANHNSNVLALISDNGAIVYDKFRKDFPLQFLNCGISEANMVGVAAGLASTGKIPFAYTISPFLSLRAFEFIRNDICIQQQNVKLVGTGAGFVYSALGPTHHATEDVSALRSLPEITLITPASPLEVKKAIIAAAEFLGPVYIRIGTNGEEEIYKHDYPFKIGRGEIINEGNDLAIITTGSIITEALSVARSLREKNIHVKIINIHTLKPIDNELLIDTAKKIKVIITLEEHSIHGGLGSAVAEVLLESGCTGMKFLRMGLDNTFCKGYGKHHELRSLNGLSANHILANIQRLLMN
ncbi:MAG: transketolase [Oligoflexia bacterium]|nr:transketolase [Oligoflexia bacterium]